MKIKNHGTNKKLVWEKVGSEAFYSNKLIVEQPDGTEYELISAVVSADPEFDYSKVDFSKVPKDSKILLEIELRDAGNTKIGDAFCADITKFVLEKRQKVDVEENGKADKKDEDKKIGLLIDQAKVLKGHILSFRADPDAKKIFVEITDEKDLAVASTTAEIKPVRLQTKDGLAEFRTNLLTLPDLKNLDTKKKHTYSIAIDNDGKPGVWTKVDSTEVDPTPSQDKDETGIELGTLLKWIAGIVVLLLLVAGIFYIPTRPKDRTESRSASATAAVQEPSASAEVLRRLTELHNYTVGLGERLNNTTNQINSLAEKLATNKTESMTEFASSTVMSSGNTNILKQVGPTTIGATNGSGVLVIGPINGPVNIGGQSQNGVPPAKRARPFHKKPSCTTELLSPSEMSDTTVPCYERDIIQSAYTDCEYTYPSQWRVIPQPSYGENVECFYSVTVDSTPENPHWVNVVNYDESRHGVVRSIHIINRGPRAFVMPFKIYSPH